MPIYEYEAVDAKAACARCRGGFEIRQSMADAPLATCPSCGHPVRKRISACGIATGTPERTLLSDKNIKDHGFMKLVNEGEGKYRKI
ncbi:MAG: zinc ribbon domain-containing protein [Planctomycetes bacterium]|nr:zinc ribbon domain-containing protein [Planctomycetota bacterium]